MKKALIFSLVAFVATGCYSVEFFPTKAYEPGAPKAATQVRLIFHKPHERRTLLGVMKVRDVTDWKEDSFQRFVRKQASVRGASTAWVVVNKQNVIQLNHYIGISLPNGDKAAMIPLTLFLSGLAHGNSRIRVIPIALYE